MNTEESEPEHNEPCANCAELEQALEESRKALEDILAISLPFAAF